MFGLTPFRRNNPMARSNFFSPWSDFERAIDSFFNNFPFPSIYDNFGVMKVDIKETDQAYILEAEIPGANKENIKLEISDDLLTIHVQANEEIQEERDRYIRKERRYSNMSRSFQIDNVRTEDVTAKYENGILYVTLPKKQPTRRNSRFIDIN